MRVDLPCANRNNDYAITHPSFPIAAGQNFGRVRPISPGLISTALSVTASDGPER